MIAATLAYAIKKPNDKKYINIVALDYMKTLSEANFEGVNDMIFISKAQMTEVTNYIHTSGIYRTENYMWGYYKKEKKDEIERYIVKGSFNFMERIKNNMLELPTNTELKYPIFKLPSQDTINELNESVLKDAQKTIIFTPYTHSRLYPVYENFWIDLTAKLKDMNFKLYTNIANDNEVPLKNTLPLKTTFPELFYLTDKVNCFIGARSGIQDFLAFSKAKILCIRGLEGWHFNLKLMFPKSNSKTFCYTAPAFEKLKMELKKFQAANCIELKMNMFVNHKHKENYLCFSKDELMQEILNSID